MDKKVKERSVSAFNNELKLKGFNVFQIEEDSNTVREYSRKDFYKICLTTGESLINYEDRSFLMKGTIIFLELLERQFPIESTSRPLKLRTAQDYATALNLHVNYLNRAVKETTGRSTT